MRYEQISIPVAVDLTKESAWPKVPGEKNAYFVVRFHYILKERQSNSHVHTGEILGAFISPKDTEISTLKSIEYEHTQLLAEESIHQSLMEQEINFEFASKLSMGIDLITGKLSNETKTNCQENLKESLTEGWKLNYTETRKTITKFEVKQTFSKEQNSKIVAAVTYQQRAIDIYLHSYDYLLVKYEKTFMGLRKKRYKTPQLNGNRHVNLVKLNWPLFTIKYWRLLPESAQLFLESEYKNEVENPFEVEMEPLNSGPQFPLGCLKKPTLYQLSNVAFPLKWVKRISDEWTEEELMKIEEEEAVGSAWWYEYGPGRRTR